MLLFAGQITRITRDPQLHQHTAQEASQYLHKGHRPAAKMKALAALLCLLACTNCFAQLVTSGAFDASLVVVQPSSSCTCQPCGCSPDGSCAGSTGCAPGTPSQGFYGGATPPSKQKPLKRFNGKTVLITGGELRLPQMASTLTCNSMQALPKAALNTQCTGRATEACEATDGCASSGGVCHRATDCAIQCWRWQNWRQRLAVTAWAGVLRQHCRRCNNIAVSRCH